VVVLPVAVELTRKISGALLLDAAWAIPVAALASVASIMFERGARGERHGHAARLLAEVTGAPADGMAAWDVAA